MKAITIHQPFATLIAIGEKDNETRGWATKHRGPLAIHAGKKIHKDLCELEPFKSVLAKHGYTADNLPTGAIVAICNLTECYEINLARETYASSVSDKGEILQVYEGNEFAFGRYEEGRFAWNMKDRQFLESPIPAKGQQGLWNWGRSHEE